MKFVANDATSLLEDVILREMFAFVESCSPLKYLIRSHCETLNKRPENSR